MRLLGCVRNSKGQTMMETVAAIGISAILLVVSASLFATQTKMVGIVKEKADALDIKLELMRDLAQQNICTCQFNRGATPDVANTSDPYLILNSQVTDGSQQMPIHSLRNGCDVGDSVVVQEGQTTGPWTVQSISLSNLMPTGNTYQPMQWKGDLEIKMKSVASGRDVSVKLSQIFRLNGASVSANPTKATIDSCDAPETHSVLIKRCPTMADGADRDWQMVGNPDEIGTYCIEKTKRAPQSLLDALITCGGVQPAGFGPSHICTYNEWYSACLKYSGSTMTDTTSSSQWMPDYDGSGAMTAGQGSCSNTDEATLNQNLAFRCCVK